MSASRLSLVCHSKAQAARSDRAAANKAYLERLPPDARSAAVAGTRASAQKSTKMASGIAPAKVAAWMLANTAAMRRIRPTNGLEEGASAVVMSECVALNGQPRRAMRQKYAHSARLPP